MADQPPGNLIHAEECFQIQGAVHAVSRTMGPGFLEAVYQECLALEFSARGVPFVAAPRLKVSYGGELLRQTYSPDFICYGRIIVELKAVREVAPEHRAQLLNYLRATGLDLGLLVNFGPAGRATAHRMVLQGSTAKAREGTRTERGRDAPLA